MKKLFSILLAALMLLTVVPMAAFADEPETPTEVKLIDTISIDFTSPEKDQPAKVFYALDNKDCRVIEARWFEVESDSFIDETATFKEGTYYIDVTFRADDGCKFSDDVKVVINGEEALSATVNADGTVNASASFDVEAGKTVAGFFGNLFATLKLVVVTVLHFIGTLIGLK